MRQEIFKISFVKYGSIEYRDRSTIDESPIKNHEDSEYFEKYPKFHHVKKYDDEGTFVQNFANPLYDITRNHCFLIVEETEKNVSLKFFHGTKHRKVGTTYFRISKNLDFLTVNKLTGDIYSGHIYDYQKKRKFKKILRKNFFLKEPLTSLTSKIKNYINNASPLETHKITEATELFLSRFCEPNEYISREHRLLKFYLDKKNFKYPNNFWIFVSQMFGEQYRKTLKKNNKRLIDTIMEINDLKGKKLKKYLHEVNNLNISLYKTAVNLFGEDWLNQDDDFIKVILNSNATLNVRHDLSIYMSNEELKRVYRCFKNIIINNETNTYTFNDHISMYCSLRDYGETIKWMSVFSDFKEFMNEHLDWTEKLEHYRKGSYTRIYPQDMIETIETQIGDYHPFLLKTTLDYNGESLFQSNCVKGYIGRPGSFIVSLRKYENGDEVRATLEYRIIKNDDKFEVFRVQSLGRFNSHLEDEWTEVLLKLDKIVLSYFRDREITTVKIKKVCSNGVELNSDSHFNEDGFLEWTDKKNDIIFLW